MKKTKKRKKALIYCFIMLALTFTFSFIFKDNTVLMTLIFWIGILISIVPTIILYKMWSPKKDKRKESTNKEKYIAPLETAIKGIKVNFEKQDAFTTQPDLSQAFLLRNIIDLKSYSHASWEDKIFYNINNNNIFEYYEFFATIKNKIGTDSPEKGCMNFVVFDSVKDFGENKFILEPGKCTKEFETENIEFNKSFMVTGANDVSSITDAFRLLTPQNMEGLVELNNKYMISAYFYKKKIYVQLLGEGYDIMGFTHKGESSDLFNIYQEDSVEDVINRYQKDIKFLSAIAEKLNK